MNRSPLCSKQRLYSKQVFAPAGLLCPLAEKSAFVETKHGYAADNLSPKPYPLYPVFPLDFQQAAEYTYYLIKIEVSERQRK